MQAEVASHAVGMQTVYLGDSRAMPMIPPSSIDFFITSPPYWHLKDYGSPGQVGQSSYEDYLRQLNEVWVECHRCARRDAVLVINVNSRATRKRSIPSPSTSLPP